MTAAPLLPADSTLGAVPPALEEVLAQSDQTLVARRRVGPGAGAVIWKELFGPDADRWARHERGILARLSGVEGVCRLVAGDYPEGTVVQVDAGGPALASVAGGRRLRPSAMLDPARGLAGIVTAVHARGVVHLDINPANIVLAGPERAPVLVDFGLATTFAEQRPGFLHPNEIAGTLAYVAPEQTRRTGHAVDERAAFADAALYRAKRDSRNTVRT